MLTTEFVTAKRLAGYTLTQIGLMFDPPAAPGTVHHYDRSRSLSGIDQRNLQLKQEHQETLSRQGYTARKCLSCQDKFYSPDPPSINRICPNCKTNNRGQVGIDYNGPLDYANTSGRARR